MQKAKKRTRVRLDADSRREQILAMATRIISQRGYNGFSIQELAQECGLTNAGLLYYFGSKEKLLIALLEDRDRRDAVAVPALAGLSGPPYDHKQPTLDQLFKLLRAIVKRNTAEPELVRLFTVLRAEALNRPHPARDYFRKRETAVLEAFTSMVAPHVKQPRSTARQLLAVLSGLEEQWLRSDHGFDLIAEWDRALAQLLPRP